MDVNVKNKMLNYLKVKKLHYILNNKNNENNNPQIILENVV